MLKSVTNRNLDLVMALDESEGITKAIRIHPDADMNMCINSSHICLDISLKDKNVNLLVVLKVKRSPKSIGFILWEP